MLRRVRPLAAFSALAPRPPAVRRLAADVSYGPLARHRLDVYAHGVPEGPRPVVVFFYGGGWEVGDRRDYGFAGRAFAARGFVSVVADYRVTGEAAYPGFLQDCALAVAWIQAHAGEFGGDPARVVLAGHSAGAYNAAMLALDRRWLGEAGAAHPVAAWAGLAGPYDFLPLSPGPGLRTFGHVADPPSTQPIRYAGPHAPPAFLAHGRKDRTVLPGNSRRLAERLSAAGVRVENRYYRSAGHGELVLALAWPLSLWLPVLDDCARFLLQATAGAAR
ncbi:MAG: alpha/beta hydrolase [Phenylobacterium sp.]|nr:alpha/beta hydrolase [Phenylobacterium sp.]